MMTRNPGNERPLVGITVAPNTIVDEKGVIRSSDGTFKKGGLSPNPGGRKKCFEIVTNFAEKHLIDAAQVVVDVMKNESEQGSTRLKAAEWIVKWSAGKPLEDMPIDANPTVTGEYSAIGMKFCTEIIDKYKKQTEVAVEAEKEVAAAVVVEDKKEEKANGNGSYKGFTEAEIEAHLTDKDVKE